MAKSKNTKGAGAKLAGKAGAKPQAKVEKKKDDLEEIDLNIYAEGEGESGGESESEVENESTEEEAEGSGDSSEESEEEGSEESEGAEGEEESPAEEEPNADKGSKGKAGAKAADEGEEKSEEFPYAEGYNTYDVPLARIKPNPMRKPSDEAIAKMVKSIKNIGLQNPIVIGTDYRIVQGNTRFGAYTAMNRKSIPCRVSVSVKGDEFFASTDGKAQLQTLAENIIRDDMSEIEKAKAYQKFIADGHASGPKELAQQLGIQAGSVTRTITLLEKSTKAMKEAIEGGKIAASGAYTIITKTDSPEDQNSLLNNLLAANEGKVPRGAVDAATQGTERKSKTKGRKPSRAPLSEEVLNTEATGISGVVVKNIAKEIEVVLTISIPLGDAENFLRFDVKKKIQQRFGEIDDTKICAELESARKRVAG